MGAPYRAVEIAKWLLAYASFDEEAVISNLKLQKLLYYAQGHYMATHGGQPLFSDEIQAWAHGPVVPNVYHEYKQFRNGPIPLDADFDFLTVDNDAGSWLATIWEKLGSRSAWKLREMTHSEPPWRDAFEPDVRNIVIERQSLMRYFGGLHAGSVAV